MPGPFAHLTMVNRFKTRETLVDQAKLSSDMALAVTQWTRLVELGAVSPDYPYLAILDKDAKIWADNMHYTKVGDRLKVGIEILQGANQPAKEKAFVWLLGFSAHIAMDLTIHPVVELKVGTYAQNATAHRDCEMHQDVYIFNEMNLGPLQCVKFLKSGIARCNDSHDKSLLDPDIKNIWMEMLQKTSTSKDWSKSPPNIDVWHRRFKLILGVAEKTASLPCFARHVLAGSGAVYPPYKEICAHCIEKLKTPEGTMNYADIFDKAQKNVAWLWSVVAKGVSGESTEYRDVIHNWDLDTGRRPDGTLEFWSQK